MKKLNIGLIIVALAVSSCADDFEPGSSSKYMDKIGYAINIANENDEFQSRGESSRNRVTVEKLDATIGDNDLYLHTVVSDSIPQAITARKHGKALSRGSITTEVDELAVSAVVINGSDNVKGWPATGESQMYMNNDPVYSDWTTGRYWPQEHDSIRFYAYSPIGALDDESVDYKKGLPSITGNPGFYYRVKENVAEQEDLLVSAAQYQGNYCQAAQLNMSHALTAVEIQISEEVTDFTLTKLTVSNVECDGIYSYQFLRNASDDTKSCDAGYWSKNQGLKSSYVLYDDETGLLLNGTGANMSYSGEEQNLLLMMIPQVLPDDAKITVEGRDAYGNAIEPLSAIIGGTDSNGNAKSWTKGQHVVYRLSFNPTRIEYVIEVNHSKEKDGSPYYSPWHGESDVNFSVRSYRRTYSAGGNVTIEPLEWEIDQSTIPAWVDKISLSGVDQATCSYSVLPNLTSSTSHDILKNNIPRGTKDAPWDLSREAVFDGSFPQNTANCYMVTAPGWYTFPLVAGNAITNGADNPSAYIGDLNGSGPYRDGTDNVRRYDVTVSTTNKTPTVEIQTLVHFCGHPSTNFHQPWIVNNNGRTGSRTSSSAKIVWQDEPCLVSDVKLSENGDYITFHVPQLCINEGNAVIALISTKDENPAWSWHIWVTDQVDRCTGNANIPFGKDENDISLTNRFITSGYKAGATTPSEWGAYKEVNFKVMHSHIGACDADTRKYTEATCDIKFNIKDENGEIIQPSSGVLLKIDVLKVGVNGYETYMPDNAPYYQFGRKDPMIPGIGNGKDKPVYLNDRSAKPELSIEDGGGYLDKKSSTDEWISLYTGVANPGVFFKGDYDGERTESGVLYETWTSDYPVNSGHRDFFINLWDATFNEMPVFSYADVNNPVDFYNKLQNSLKKSVVKTIYDPCPVGYEMPRYDAFTGFTFEGENVSPFLIKDVSVAAGYSLVNDVNIDEVWPNMSALTTSNIMYGLKFFTKTMPRRQARSAFDVSSSSDRLFVHALGHRTRTGQVAKYNEFAGALTANPMCVRWIENNSLLDYYKFQGSRLCLIGSPNFSVRSISTSDFDLAFNIIPAKTGCNPSSINVDKDNIGWTDGNKADYGIEF